MTPPAIPQAFRWTDESWGLALRCRPLDDVAPHLFTTRQLELSDDDAARQLAAAVGAPGGTFMPRQVHGRHAVLIERGGPVPEAAMEADAVVSRSAITAVAVRAADCVPLLIADAATGAVAAVHAGWRGTAAGIAAATVRRMHREFGSAPADLVVAVGPSIGPCCYEVGSELVDAFAAAGHERLLIDRWFVSAGERGSRDRAPIRLDVAGANRDQLVLAGVPESQIHMSGLCTAMHLDVLTSFRAEKDSAGRLAAVIRAAR